jgi:dynein intermediate chain 1, axonemal
MAHFDAPCSFSLQPEDLAKNLNFYSISSDGRVTLWTLAKSNLEYSDLMKLKLEPSAMSKQARCGTTQSLLWPL